MHDHAKRGASFQAAYQPCVSTHSRSKTLGHLLFLTLETGSFASEAFEAARGKFSFFPF